MESRSGLRPFLAVAIAAVVVSLVSCSSSKSGSSKPKQWQWYCTSDNRGCNCLETQNPGTYDNTCSGACCIQGYIGGSYQAGSDECFCISGSTLQQDGKTCQEELAIVGAGQSIVNYCPARPPD